MSEKKITQTPASRLLEFVVKARSRIATGQSEKQRAVWASMLGCSTEDTYTILSGIAEVLRTIDTCKTDVRRLQKDHSLFLETLAEIEAPFKDLQLEGQWRSFCAPWTDATVRTLRFVELELTIIQPKSDLSTKDVTDLLIELGSVEAAIRDVECDPRLKQVVLEHLHAVRRALNAYAIGGVEYLELAVSQALGAVFIHRELFEQPTSVTSKYVDIVKRGGALARFARGAKFILTQAAEAREAVDKILGGG